MKHENTSIRRVTVYCGSSADTDSLREAARGFGGLLASEGLGVVFGGGAIGMMRAVADGALDGGGEVIGVVPDLFRRELAHRGVQQIIETDTFHARKQRMFELGDAFVALPGGLGTVEELIEVWDWARLGLHEKPVGVLDVEGYYSQLFGFFDHMLERGFCSARDREMLHVSDQGPALLDQLRAYRAPAIDRPWARY